MSLIVRRVITGRDEDGRAIVSIDEISKNVVQTRPDAHAVVIWTSEGFWSTTTGAPTRRDAKSAPQSTTAPSSGW
jgi:hypothetical protein